MTDADNTAINTDCDGDEAEQDVDCDDSIQHWCKRY